MHAKLVDKFFSICTSREKKRHVEQHVLRIRGVDPF